MNLDRLYLDYNATSPLSESVTNWLKSGDLHFANPSSQHSDGKSSRRLVNEARAFIYKTFSKDEKTTNLFFHSGATEAFHSFAYSFSETARLAGKDLLICFSSIDHPAVTALNDKYFGPHVKVLELKREKDLSYCHDENFETLKDRKDNNPELIILYHHLWVHNETGEVSPLEDLKIFKSIPDLYLHVDAVQAPGKIPGWQNLNAGDIWSFSAHKFGALKGVGFSLFNKSIPFHPLIVGGGQQNNFRSGTENIHGVRSTALALGDLLKVNVIETMKIRERFILFMESELKGLGEVLHGKEMASNTVYFYLQNYTSDIALAVFDVNGIEISAGSACSSGAAKASMVLSHKGLVPVAKNGLRISLPFSINEEDLNRIQDRLRTVFNKLRHS